MSRSLTVVALAACVGGLAACGSGTDTSGAESPGEADAATDSISDPGPDPVGDDTEVDLGTDDGSSDVVGDDDPVANAPVLVPTATFAIDNPDQVSSVAMSPDGAQIAVATQAALGDPVTITLYDTTTGEAGNSTQADAIGLSILQWMADNRLVAYADRESDPVWRSWDGSTLDELPAVPLDFSCYTGRADRNTGVVYASDGLISMGNDLCRVDTADGSVLRTGDGAGGRPSLAGADRGHPSSTVTRQRPARSLLETNAGCRSEV